MSQPKSESGRKATPAGSSRTLVVAAVVGLIVIALAGIVLASRKSGEGPVVAEPVAAAPANAARPIVAATSQAGSAPTSSGSDEVMFLAASSKLPPGASEKIADAAQRAKASDQTFRVTLRYLTGANKERALELAKSRAEAVRHEAMADGVTGKKMQTELVEMPEGSLSARDADRAVITLR